MHFSDSTKYDLLTRVIHWVSVLMITSVFFSGLYMVDLDYYSPWYQTIPQWHQLMGISLMLLWLYKLFRLKKITALSALKTHNIIERRLALIVKCLFYVLLFTITISGYLFTTSSESHAVILFDLFQLPQLFTFSSQNIDIMGLIHKYLSYFFMVLALIHALAAIKHHFIDKDNTLKRML